MTGCRDGTVDELPVHADVPRLIESFLDCVDQRCTSLLVHAIADDDDSDPWAVSRLPLQDKVLLVEEACIEYGASSEVCFVWLSIRSLLDGFQTGSVVHATKRARVWMDRLGFDCPASLQDVPETFRTEMRLRNILAGLLVYVSAWVDALMEEG